MPKRPARNSGFANPEMAKEVLVHLLSVAQGSGFQLSPGMLEEIEAISIVGADPDWQISELRKILDRWVTQH
jgi:hypothetical protein